MSWKMGVPPSEGRPGEGLRLRLDVCSYQFYQKVLPSQLLPDPVGSGLALSCAAQSHEAYLLVGATK